MELEGKIEVVLKPKSGVSQRGPWKSQVVVMKYFWFPNQQYPSEIVLSIFGEERIDRWNLEVNDEVKIRYHAEAREFNGQWYGENRPDALTFIGASAQKQHLLARHHKQHPQRLSLRFKLSQRQRQRRKHKAVPQIRTVLLIQTSRKTCHSNIISFTGVACRTRSGSNALNIRNYGQTEDKNHSLAWRLHAPGRAAGIHRGQPRYVHSDMGEG